MANREQKIGVLTQSHIEQSSHRVADGRKARIGFIGAGWWATTNHMPLLKARPDVEMVSACGLDKAVLARCKRDFGFAHTTSDYRELLKQDLDGVVVASPHAFHAEHALAALKAGCHVLVEKPFTTNAKKAREIVALGRKKRLHIVVPYGWHYRPIGRKAREVMVTGAIGKVEFVLCHMASQLKNLFTGRSFDFKEGAYVIPKLSTWADPRLSDGGYGQGQLSHATGMMLWLTGLQPTEVYARMTQPGAKVDMYDAMSVKFAGEAIGNISGAATLPMGTPGSFQLDVRIFGRKGMLVLDIARDHLSLHRHDGRHETIALEPGDGAYRCDGPPNEFIDLVLGRTKTNSSPGEVALRSVEILDAAYRSSRSGKSERV